MYNNCTTEQRFAPGAQPPKLRTLGKSRARALATWHSHVSNCDYAPAAGAQPPKLWATHVLWAIRTLQNARERWRPRSLPPKNQVNQQLLLEQNARDKMRRMQFIWSIYIIFCADIGTRSVVSMYAILTTHHPRRNTYRRNVIRVSTM